MKALDLLRQHLWLLAILLLAAFLRFYHLGFQSLWLDEIFTMNVSNPALTSEEFKYEMLLREGFPYLYFYILKFFYAIFGYTVVVARSVSALSGILGVYSIYLLGKELFSKNAGLIAGLLLSINEYNIFISQDARPYSLYFLATVLSFYRLAILLQNATIKNAIWYGLFTGFLLNVNFFGFVNVFSQSVIIVFFLILAPRQEKLNIVKLSAIAGILALLLFLPNYAMLDKLLGWKSFWVLPPAADSFTFLFREFLGNSEMTLFVLTPVFLYYLITVFRHEDTFENGHIKSNKLQFSFVLMFGWMFVFAVFLMLKSYLDISLMLARYFTSITPIFFIVLGIGLYLIKNKLARSIVIISIVTFTLINLFAVKDYYNKVTKTQFREISKEILEKNTSKDKVVSSWGYLFNYFLKPHTNKNTIECPLDVYVQDMMKEKVDNLSFWYVDGNSRPYKLSPDLEEYLNANFIVDQTIDYHDTWAKHYKSKAAPGTQSFLTLNDFKPSLFDGSGAMIFVENMTSNYPPFNLEKGKYDIIIKGVSLPDKPLNGENAHFRILINGKEIGDFYLSNEANNPGSVTIFENPQDNVVKFQLIYDNDAVINGVDRNAIINSIQIKKK